MNGVSPGNLIKMIIPLYGGAIFHIMRGIDHDFLVAFVRQQ
jgi:hypothetical protein